LFAPGGKEKDACRSRLSTSAGGVLAIPYFFGEYIIRLVVKRDPVKLALFTNFYPHGLVNMYDFHRHGQQKLPILGGDQALAVQFLQPEKHNFCDSVPSPGRGAILIMYRRPPHQASISHLNPAIRPQANIVSLASFHRNEHFQAVTGGQG
jgi:hypothetical protein